MSVRSPRTFSSPASVVSLAVLTVFFGLVLPSAASAQDNPSLWGVRVSFTPGWEISDSIRKIFFEPEDNGVMKGSEFSIGFVRGSVLGGDWGVSFVRKPFDNASGTNRLEQDCFNQAQTICRPNHEVVTFDNVYLNAFEVHWFLKLVNIGSRAQVGLNVGGGLGSMKGNIVTVTDRFEPTGFNQNGPTGFTPIHEEEVTLAKDELLPFFPLGKVEVEGALIVAPGLKVKIAGGMNFPATSFRVGAVYLFGAK
jgi:hypothetical protein